MKYLEQSTDATPSSGVVEVKAPNKIPAHNNIYLFLAGSIEMGSAAKWHDKVIKALGDLNAVTALNPRRDDWDSSWKQTIENEQFFTQVDWEHEGLQLADIVIFNFEPETKSPITLLELGLMADSDKFKIVRCPKEFWRRGNVEYICDRYNIPLVDTLDDLIKELRDVLQYDFDIEPAKETE